MYTVRIVYFLLVKNQIALNWEIGFVPYFITYVIWTKHVICLIVVVHVFSCCLYLVIATSLNELLLHVSLLYALNYVRNKFVT